MKKEVPYDGLEWETIPMYYGYGVYINDEIVCRVHIIDANCKKIHFIEFSSKRDRDEVIEIIKEAHKTAKEHNHDQWTKWFSKYDSKSFYQDYSSSGE